MSISLNNYLEENTNANIVHYLHYLAINSPSTDEVTPFLIYEQQQIDDYCKSISENTIVIDKQKASDDIIGLLPGIFIYLDANSLAHKSMLTQQNASTVFTSLQKILSTMSATEKQYGTLFYSNAALATNHRGETLDLNYNKSLSITSLLEKLSFYNSINQEELTVSPIIPYIAAALTTLRPTMSVLDIIEFIFAEDKNFRDHHAVFRYEALTPSDLRKIFFSLIYVDAIELSFNNLLILEDNYAAFIESFFFSFENDVTTIAYDAYHKPINSLTQIHVNRLFELTCNIFRNLCENESDYKRINDTLRKVQLDHRTHYSALVYWSQVVRALKKENVPFEHTISGLNLLTIVAYINKVSLLDFPLNSNNDYIENVLIGSLQKDYLLEKNLLHFKMIISCLDDYTAEAYFALIEKIIIAHDDLFEKLLYLAYDRIDIANIQHKIMPMQLVVENYLAKNDAQPNLLLIAIIARMHNYLEDLLTKNNSNKLTINTLSEITNFKRRLKLILKGLLHPISTENVYKIAAELLTPVNICTQNQDASQISNAHKQLLAYISMVLLCLNNKKISPQPNSRLIDNAPNFSGFNNFQPLTLFNFGNVNTNESAAESNQNVPIIIMTETSSFSWFAPNPNEDPGIAFLIRDALPKSKTRKKVLNEQLLLTCPDTKETQNSNNTQINSIGSGVNFLFNFNQAPSSKFAQLPQITNSSEQIRNTDTDDTNIFSFRKINK